MIHQKHSSSHSTLKGSPLQIYLTRHGQTDWNQENRLQGQLDIPLNAAGIQQAEALSGFLQNVKIDRAFTSSLVRSEQTAEIVLQNRLLNLEILDNLKELNLGDWQGKLQTEVSQEFALWQSNAFATPKSGETLHAFHTRVSKTWDKLIQDSTAKTQTNVLVVAHKWVNAAILCHILGLSLNHFWDFATQGNCEVTIIDYPQGYQGVAYLRDVNLDPTVNFDLIAA